jgi:hypothetical protein
MAPTKTKEKPSPAATTEEAAGGGGDGGVANAETTDEATLALQEQLAERDETIAKLEAELEEKTATIEHLGTHPTEAATLTTTSGERRTVTYLGRPDQIARDEEGEPAEEDVYVSVDHANANKGIRMQVGESVEMSAEKASQLAADFPDAFDVD